MDSKTSSNPFAVDALSASAPFAPWAQASDEERLANAAEGTYEYKLIEQAPAPSADEVESKAEALEITVRWGQSLLHVEHVSPPRANSLGEGADFFLPSEKLGHDKVELVRIEAGRPVLGSSGAALALGAEQKVAFGDVTVTVALVQAGKKVRGGLGLAKKGLGSMLAAFALHATVLGGAAVFMPPLADASTDGIGVEQQALLQQYLAAAAEKEAKELEGEKAEQKEDKAQAGGGARGESGAAGNPSSKKSDGRAAVAGPKENREIHLSKAEALKDAQDFGFVGLLATMGGDRNAPKSPWGDFTLGNDAVSANGHLWGNDVGDAYGSGLALTGIGDGGGNPIGNGLIGTGGPGGLGTCLSQNNCGGNGFSRGLPNRGHTPAGIKLRPGVTSTSGVLPPEIIQRGVRQNFGRFRMCYENGLRGNPNLAGRVSVRFVIGRDGVATGAQNGGSDLPDSGVVSCVVRAFNGLSFPAPESGIVTVTYPIQFTSN